MYFVSLCTNSITKKLRNKKVSIIEFFSKLKTLLQINNSNNKTIKGNNNIIVGENAAIIQNPINIPILI